MLADHKRIQEGLIQHARVILDGLLSEMPSAFGSLPSVIQDRVKAPRPDFPYVVVDKMTSLRGAGDGGWLRNTYTDENDQVHYVHEHRVGMNITCYGEDADSILNLLRVSVVDDWIRKDLNSKTGAIFCSYSDIGEKPLFIETDFIDGAEMDVFFTAISDWTSPLGSSVIKSVEVSGTYEISDITTEIVVDSTEN